MEEKLKVIKKLAKLIDRDKWVLVGGASRALQGIDDTINDIDILTDRVTAEKFYILLKNNVVKKLEMSENLPFKSYFGVYELDGVKIEVMADLEIKGEDNMSVYNASLKRMLSYDREAEVEGIKIRVEPAEEALIANVLLGRIERAKKLAKFLAKKGFDDGYLERVEKDEKLSKALKEDIREMLVR